MRSEYESESDSEASRNGSDSGGHKSESDSEASKNGSDSEVREIEPDSEGSVTGSDEDLKTKIFLTLKRVKTPSAFAYSNIDWCLPNPCLYLPPYGALGLPLSTDDAKKIIAQARKSPFGKGEKTIVDSTIRKSWELNPNQFSLKNPGWNNSMKKILDSVTMGLGLGKVAGQVSAELHKLLLYEPGAFFKPHKDSEKARGMFATLVVCLQSPHEGGKLVLTHDGEKYEFDTASSSSFGCSYAAWYSDITHEVLPVVSGYRLVLVYNLIRQADFEVPSYTLVCGRMKQLSTLLQEYDSRLEEGDDKLPPILLHKLSHKYTQANLKLNALKPPDLAQVQVLKQLATKLGFNIYLATLELIVNRDDECPNETIEREQILENVVELDGKLVVERVDYPDGALTDPEGQNEDVPDGEEHEGPTGNEGSPAVYWYRDTVVALLPPSRQLHLVFKFQFDGSIIEPLFCKLMQEFAQDPTQKPKLEQLCKLALKQKPQKRYDYQSRQSVVSVPPFFRQAAITALDLGRADLFDEACKDMCNKFLLDDAHALGRSVATNGVAAKIDRLMNCLQVVSSVAEKVKFLGAVMAGFETAVPQPSSTERGSLKRWSDEAILTAVAQLATLTRTDGMSLARLCKTMEWRLFESKAKPIVLKAGVTTKITFINEFMSTLQLKLTEEQRSFTDIIIRSIWKQFLFKAESGKSEPQTSSWSWLQSESNSDYKVVFKENDLPHIIENTVRIFSSKCVEKLIIPAMLRAIPITSKRCAKELFPPLVQMILKNKLAGFKLPTEVTAPPTSHKRLVLALLTKYLLEHVNPKPAAPTDWSVPPHSCKCNDCSVVNAFLRDPRRQSFDFPCAERRRDHLTHIFKDWSCSYYDITTIRGRSPYVWQITKNQNNYKRAKSEWENNTRTALQPLLTLKNEEPVRGRLEVYLQPYYGIIMNANVTRLPDLKSLVTIRQSSGSNENAASSLNQSTNPTGFKRGAGDMSLPKDELTKRTKS